MSKNLIKIEAGELFSKMPRLKVVYGVAQELTPEQVSLLSGLGHRVQNLDDLSDKKGVIAIAESQNREINLRLKQKSLNL